MMNRRSRWGCWPAGLVLLALASAAGAQPSNIDPANKYCWGENAGFLNWRDANGGTQGVVVHHAFLSGFIWSETAGWIRVGNGTDPGPGTCFQYVSPGAQTGATYGVNIGAFSLLSGFGWGENIGWVNFSTASGTRPSSQWARYDRVAKRFRGFAWSENAGWINLDSASVFVADTLCRADTDGNGLLEPADVSLFVNIWFCSLASATSAGDFDGNGLVEPADVSLFVSAWFTALTTGSC